MATTPPPPTIIGYYTANTPYEVEAKQFTDSLQHYHLAYKLYRVESKASWELNCGQKPHIILQALDELQSDLLYLDVDARIMRDPPFDEIQKHKLGFCVWTRPLWRKELLSGTIYVPNNELSRELLRHWIEEQAKQPKRWDQRVLQQIYELYPHYLMPLNWVAIEGNRWLKALNPIILHTQASRRHKSIINTPTP